MKLLSRVTNKDVGHLIFTLADARKRPQSENFLEGVPLAHRSYGTRWKSCAVPEFENLYLFWDGVAWGHIPQHAWMGLSPDMGDYAYYQRVLKAGRTFPCIVRG